MLTRRTRASLGILSSVALASTVLAIPAGASTDLSVPSAAADAVEAEKATQEYVVVLDDDPVATYDGEVAGLAATRDVAPSSARARNYERFLERQANRALRRNGISTGAKDEQFTHAVSGFTADLTAGQVERLRADSRVLTVAPNEIRQLTTDSTPDFLGLTDEDGGLWADLGIFGEDVVIGVIDSGIRPESPSFADDGSYEPLADWDGACETGEDDSFTCDAANDKLIGARWYVDGFGGAEQTIADFPQEFLSPLDADGHGTHTASTAGGNGGVETPFGTISGIAPRARVAAYKVCWGYSGEGGCATTDSVAAIDQAVADGVDVINYSISGTTSNYLDPVELAFLFATDAGVVVNASAGNSGPLESTVNHPSPWINTVAAGTEEAQFRGSVTIGGEGDGDGECESTPVATNNRRARDYEATATGVVDGEVTVTVTYNGEGRERVRLRNGRTNGTPGTAVLTTGESVEFTIDAEEGDRLVVRERLRRNRWIRVARFDVVACDSVGDPGSEEQTFEGAPSIGNPGTELLPLIYSGDAPAEGVAVEDAQLCLEGSLDPSAIAGMMVLCDRGAIARVAKSDTVAAAGGVAMILGNTSPNSLNSDAHVIPTTHVDEVANAAIKEYIASTDTPVASQAPAEVVQAVAPDVAQFSSRGPALAPGGILKPDILAPGVDILAAYSPTISGRDFDYLSGTSMSSPHMAGVSALLKEAHPEWSSPAIQSAVMTTAYTERTDGSPIAGGPFAYGSGHVAPNSAVDPGLVYDADFDDYVDFLCGTGQLLCGGFSFDPADLNEPNIAISELAGSQTVERTVTNVTDDTVDYLADVDAPEGIDVAVSPRIIRLAPGASATFDVTFTTENDAAIGETTFGELTWRSGGREVTSQLVVTPVQLAAPDEVSGVGVEGSTTYEVGFGYNGPFTAAAHGLVPATQTDGTVVDDPANDINTALATGVGVTFESVTVPEGTAYTRIALFDAYTDGDDDLDLYVFDPEGNFVGQSGSGTSEEQVDIQLPAAGDYIVAVHGWQTDGPDSNYTLFDWSVSADPADDDGSLAVDAPTEAVLGETAEVTASWSGLDTGTKYLGAVSYTDTELFGLTVVSVDTD